MPPAWNLSGARFQTRHVATNQPALRRLCLAPLSFAVYPGCVEVVGNECPEVALEDSRQIPGGSPSLKLLPAFAIQLTDEEN